MSKETSNTIIANIRSPFFSCRIVNLIGYLSSNGKCDKSSKDDKRMSESDVFFINPSYKQPQVRRIMFKQVHSDNTISVEEGKEEMEKSRSIELQTHIIRVMKARKRCSHTELFSEVYKNVSHRFSPTMDLFKKQISSLIDNGYLERDEEKHDVYIYIS